MRSLSLSLLLAFALSVSSSWGATRTWIATVGTLWSDPANWQGGVAPVNGDRLVFPAGSGIAADNDLVNAVLDGIDVGDTLFVYGNPFTLTSLTPITVHTRLDVAQAIRFASPSPLITAGNSLGFSGDLTFAGGTVRIVGPNAQLWIPGAIHEEAATSLVFNVFETTLFAANSFTGTLTVNGGGVMNSYFGSLGSTSSGTTLSNYAFIVQGYQNQAFSEPLNLVSVPTFSIDASTITSPIVLSGTTMFGAAGGAARFVGPISGSGRMVVPPVGAPITLAGTNTFTGGLEVNSDVRIDGWDAIPAASELVIQSLGHFDIGTYSGRARRLACSGTFALTAGGYLLVTEDVDLTGCSLQLTIPPAFGAPTSEIPIISRMDPAPVTGTFNGLPEGSVVMVNGATRYITYTGGSGNDVVLRMTQGSPYPPHAPNIQDMWWSSIENGWGMSIVQHGDKLFSVIYAYDGLGKPTWYVMPTGAWDQSFTSYTGDVYAPRGSPFFEYDARRFVPGPGIGTIAITLDNAINPSNAIVDYTIEGATGRKILTHQGFGRGTTVSGGSHGDMWWGGANENGWGLAVLQQGDTLFNVWFTYDAAGSRTWFVMPGGTWPTPDTYDGRIYRTLGSPWLGRPYDPTQLQVFDAGPYRLRFNGDSATFDYSIDGHSGTFQLDRQPF